MPIPKPTAAMVLLIVLAFALSGCLADSASSPEDGRPSRLEGWDRCKDTVCYGESSLIFQAGVDAGDTAVRIRPNVSEKVDCEVSARMTFREGGEPGFYLFRDTGDYLFGWFTQSDYVVQAHVGPADTRDQVGGDASPASPLAKEMDITVTWENVDVQEVVWVVGLDLAAGENAGASSLVVHLSCTGGSPSIESGTEVLPLGLAHLDGAAGVSVSHPLLGHPYVGVDDSVAATYTADRVYFRGYSFVTRGWETGLLRLDHPGGSETWLMNMRNSFDFRGEPGDYRLSLTDVRGGGPFFGFIVGLSPHAQPPDA